MPQPTFHYPQAPQQLLSNLPQSYYLLIPPLFSTHRSSQDASVTIPLETRHLPYYVQHPSPISNQSRSPSLCTVPLLTSLEPTSPEPPQAPQLLHELWDLDLGNVKASPYVRLRATSLLPPPPLPPTSRDLLSGLTPYWELSRPKLTPSTSYNDPTLTFLATTICTTQHSYVP
ncbi:hypothetical protein F5876DRAFT_84431 [Lentinula aff. lateritia]|uniref:Uncharacterized protein n=1 Tax=Lentinula aff. lateritia TaxID=2804960 RepID=A0ACC1TGW2_9AGAR|nr:hypothetical protein F5876DRAFT_84431 [Lentinula aff. lateritia]